MMPHWLTVTLRCWIAFIAFTNFGAAFRSFTNDNFLHSKFFGNEVKESSLQQLQDRSVLGRVYGFWSLINGIILLNSFFFIEEKKILWLAVCVIVLYLSFFAIEGGLYKTVLIHGPTIYPCVLSGLTLFWLLAGLKCLYTPKKDECDENEILRKQFPFKNTSKKIR
ncbi:uncharacterized protein LOC129220227 [Uloborus diversus]|uniref:uncharacterized protein LOC129220227 n=1 Tax=Uloborus diversus TaxID=327109 RepID=UPI00240A2BD9|nr:uncharacterized protein LOC129220227 [Uloborus diversus]